MAYSDLVSLAQTTNLILNPLKYSISVAEREEITSIRQHALTLISFLEKFPEKVNGFEGKIRDVATGAEDIIEYFMWEQIDAISRGLGPSRAEIGQQLRKSREEIGSIAGDMVDDRLCNSPSAISSTRLASTGGNELGDFFSVLTAIRYETSSTYLVDWRIQMGVVAT